MGGALQAILWDVDGTLAETELAGHRLAFNAAFADHGLSWSWDADTYRSLLRVGGGRERIEAWWQRIEGAAPAPAQLDALVASKKRHYTSLLRSGGVPLRDGVARLLAAAAAAGLEQMIVTTSSRAAVAALAASSLAPQAHVFRGWVCGDDVVRKKPDPEGYRLALQQLGLAPARVLVVEDSPQGLSAARAAGLTTLITLSEVSRDDPLPSFSAAAAVVDGLGSTLRPLRLLQGPACPQGLATLSWLQRLLPSP